MPILQRLVVLFGFLLSPLLMANAKLTNFSLQQEIEIGYVTLTLTSPVEPVTFFLDNPKRIVIDLPETELQCKLPKDEKSQGVQRIRSAQQKDGTLRIVLDVTEEWFPNVKRLSAKSKASQEQRVRIIWELAEKQKIIALFQDSKTAVVKKQAIRTPKRFVVAIDPGHGGKDPGAIGRAGTYEKDVVLSIAKKLMAQMRQDPSFTPILTRETDVYLSLQDRVRKARAANADLFVSIHADAFTNTHANGASVYVLSERGASSAAAKWLADSENRSDLIGGVTLNDKSDLLASVLFDLSQTANNASSMKLGEIMLHELSKVTDLHKHSIEKAGFAVLKAPDMPSILVEAGFLSNRHGEKRLMDDKHQEKLAKALIYGIKSYFAHQPKLQMIAQEEPGLSSSTK